MIQIRTFLIFSFLIIAACNAFADSPVALYSKWKSVDSQRLMDMGQKFDNNNSCDSALVCYSVVADRLRDTASGTEEKQILARALNNIGFIYATYFFDYQKAVELFDESLKVSNECDYRENIPYVYLNIGGVYLGCNMMYGKRLFSDEVWDYLERALKSALDTRQYEVAFVAFLNMGQMYFGDPRNERLQRAIRILNNAKLPRNMKLGAFCRQYARGLQCFIKKDYQGAVAHFKGMNALIPDNDIHTKRYELVTLMAETETYKAAGDYKTAIAIGLELLDKARACGSSDVETNTYGLLADLYDKDSQKEKAAEYLLQFHHKKDSTLSERDMTLMSKMPLVNELKEMKKTLEEERTKRLVMVITVIVSAVFIVLLVLYLITLSRSRRKLRSYVKELYRKNVELIKSEQLAREMREEKDSEPDAKYSSSSLTPSESKQIAECILKVMDDTELITNPEFSLKELAQHAGYSYKAISQVVNETLGKNFKTLLNEYRVKEACKRMLDTDNYGQYTLEHIAESVGFKSRSNFSVMFKKITGLTPAQFQKNAISDTEE